MYTKFIDIKDNSPDFKQIFRSYNNEEPIKIYLEYNQKKCSSPFNTKLLENYINQIKSFFPNKEITYNVIYSLDADYVVDSKECKQLEEIDEYLRNNQNTELFLNDVGEAPIPFGFRTVLSSNRKLDSIADKIKNTKFNGEDLSPFEKFMLAYEYVTQFAYLESNKDSSNSRYWINVLDSDRIVCVGYASLLKALCERIFSPDEVQLFNQSLNVCNTKGDTLGGHQNNLIYIKDDKYGIDGIFYVDACWDSKNDNRPSCNAYCCLPILDVMESKRYRFNFCVDDKSHSTFTNLYLLKNSNEYEDFIVQLQGAKVETNDIFSKIERYLLDKKMPNRKKSLPGLLKYDDYMSLSEKEKEKFLSSYIENMSEKASTSIPLNAFVNSYKIIGASHKLEGVDLQNYIRQRFIETSKVINNDFNLEACNNCFAKEIVKQRKANKV